MISFPTTLNTGGSNINNPQQSNSVKDVLANSFKNAFAKQVSNLSNISSKNLDTSGIKYDVNRDDNELIDKFNFAVPVVQPASVQIKNNNPNYINKSDPYMLDEYKFGRSVLNVINNYGVSFKKNSVAVESGIDNPTDETNKKYTHHGNVFESVVPSLFNPMYGLNGKGISRNVPLTNTESNEYTDSDFNDCSIARLVKLSNQKSSPLGLARYKYADFMYCRDLGKISNNRLITLRKFSIPVGDNIFEGATLATSGGKKSNMTMPSDIGRMITWFDTDENKLEDIMSYDYEATFVQKEGKIQQLDSQEEDDARGPMGKIINSMSAAYNRNVDKGIADGGALKWLLGRFGVHPAAPAYASNDVALGRNYDNNKIYEPRDTVRDTYLYEGKLVFKHEFALTFNYKLRAYDNINPKAAMLDLLGNILSVTYRRGKFWGGAQQIIGPQPNYEGWAKADAFLGKAKNAAGSFLDDLFGLKSVDFEQVMGIFSNMFNTLGIGSGLQKVIEGVQDAASALVNGDTDKLKEQANNAYNGFKKLWNNCQLGAAFSGMIKNTLGRPSLYAFDSILSGSNVGLWHVTIGNPLNPIAVFGNLIMTNCKVTHSGPLGLDDFPTDLKVTVSLKHGRGRDAVDIAKMYTRGEQSIMIPLTSPYTRNESVANKEELKVGQGNLPLKGLLGSDNDSPVYGFTGSYEEWEKNAEELR